MRLASLLGHVVHHADLIEQGFELFHKLLVGGVGEVNFQSGFVGKGDEEAVGEAVVETFRADVDAPLIPFDGVDLRRQLTEGLFDVLDLLGAGAVFELEEDDVAIGGFGSRGGGHEEKGGGKGEKEGFHAR